MKPAHIFTCSLIVVAIFSVGCKQSNTKKEVKKPGMDSVVVFTLQKEAVNKQITFPAELIPMERAEIFPKVSGYISSLKVDIGDQVRKDRYWPPWKRLKW